MDFTVIIFSLIGIIGGVLGGMGMGGGTLLIPLLTIFLNLPQKEAQAINLIAFLPMSIIALILHYKNKLLKFKNVGYVILSGLFTCVFGFFIAKNLSGEILKRFFGVFLLILSVTQFLFATKDKNSK